MMPTDAAPRRFTHLFGGPRESSDLVGIARGACREGYAVIPIEPGGKRALCTLGPRQASAMDKMAAYAAKQAGKRHWEAARHPCGLSHAITDPKEAERVFKRLVDQHPDLNLALECSQSRLICVDCDNLDELRSFTELWAREEGIPELADAAPTVRTPGKIDTGGTWVHQDGGHYWFLLPEGVDFIDTSISTSLPVGLHEAKAQIRFGRSYALVPPSVRAEGPYVMASDIGLCPGWLLEFVRNHVEGVRNRRVSHTAPRDGTDQIDVWAAQLSWEELLSEDGWTSRGRPDNCGCPVWTRPGEWTNPKSATAHEPGCLRWDDGGFLHIWTDNPPEFIAAYRAATGHSSMSKLQYVAWRDHEGNDGEAMVALGIRSPSSGDAEPMMGYDDLSALIRENRERAKGERGQEAAADSSVDEDPADEDPEAEQRTSWWFKDLAEVLSGDNPEPEPLVLARVDGKCLFYAGKVNGLLGESESGKTWVALQAVAQQLNAGLPVLYLDFEDTARGIVGRLRSMGVSDETMHPNAELMAYIGPEESLNAMSRADLVEAMYARSWSLIVLDGYNAALSTMGLELKENSDITKFFTSLLRPLSATGAAVVTIDHVVKDPESKTKGGIGAQAKRATMTGCAVRVDVLEPFGRGRSGRLSITVDKDRPGYVRGVANGKSVWAEVEIKAGGDGDMVMSFTTPEEITKAGTSNPRAEEFRVKVSSFMYENDAEMSGNLIEKSITGNGGLIREALAWLVEQGYVARRLDPKTKRTQLHSFIRVYQSVEDVWDGASDE